MQATDAESDIWCTMTYQALAQRQHLAVDGLYSPLGMKGKRDRLSAYDHWFHSTGIISTRCVGLVMLVTDDSGQFAWAPGLEDERQVRQQQKVVLLCGKRLGVGRPSEPSVGNSSLQCRHKWPFAVEEMD